jgi:predicted dehydrogenase
MWIASIASNWRIPKAHPIGSTPHSCAARYGDSNQAMIRAAIVGLGRWGRSLVASVAGKNADIGFVLACTRTRGAAEDFCREHKLPLVDSYEEVFRRSDIDAVVLATPHSLHEAQVLAAIAAGKHVFVEKPLTLDLKSARRVADAANKAGCVLAVGLNRRFHPSFVELRARAQAGRLGRIVAMVAQHTTSTAQFVPLDNWRAAPEEAPGGAFAAVGIHALDYMIALGGRVRELRCVTARNYPGRSDDTTSIMLQFADGATGLMFCSVATATNFEFIAYGTGGLGEISRPNLSRLRFAPAATEAPTGLIPAPPDEIVEFSSFDTLHAELTAFARSIREKKPYPVPVDDVLHGMAVLDAIVTSAQIGETVTVPQ